MPNKFNASHCNASQPIKVGLRLILTGFPMLSGPKQSPNNNGLSNEKVLSRVLVSRCMLQVIKLHSASPSPMSHEWTSVTVWVFVCVCVAIVCRFGHLTQLALGSLERMPKSKHLFTSWLMMSVSISGCRIVSYVNSTRSVPVLATALEIWACQSHNSLTARGKQWHN